MRLLRVTMSEKQRHYFKMEQMSIRVVESEYVFSCHEVLRGMIHMSCQVELASFDKGVHNW